MLNELKPPRRFLMGPGPSDVNSRVLKALSIPMIGHLDPQFIQIMVEVMEMTRQLFQTTNQVTSVISGTGSAGMETCFVNLLEPGDTAIVCVNGVFGRRMCDIVERCGANLVIVDAPWGEPIDFIHQIGAWTAIQHAIPEILMPLIMVVMLTRFFGENKSIKEGLAIWPYAIFAGLCLVIPYLWVAIFLSPEFPGMLGGLIGLMILIPSTKAGFLLPKQSWDFPEKVNWPDQWTGSIMVKENSMKENLSLFKAWVPYVLIGLLLVLTRMRSLPFIDWIKSIKFSSPELFGTSVVTNFTPLNIPGIMPFMLIALICIPLFNMNRKQVRLAWGEALKRIKGPFIALIFAVPLVRVMMQSGANPNEYVSMPIAMAEAMARVFQGAWPLIDTFVGALGAFMAGSNTVSNILFALFQYSVADNLGISHIIVVSLQNVGGAIGNMICVHNVIAASATVGLIGVEGLLIKQNLIPMTFAALVAGIIGLLLAFLIVPGLF